MSVGTIKIFDSENRCGCVQADGDHVVRFFHRKCIASEYLPRKGDRVTFNVRANPRTGRPEAQQIQLVAAA